MELVRFNMKRCKRKKIGEQLYTTNVSGAMTHLPQNQGIVSCEVSIGPFSGMENTDERFLVSLAPAEAVELGKRLVESGERWLKKIQEVEAAGGSIPDELKTK